MKYVLSGYYGFGNAGDDAILAAIVAGLREYDPEAEITVIGPSRLRLEWASEDFSEGTGSGAGGAAATSPGMPAGGAVAPSAGTSAAPSAGPSAGAPAAPAAGPSSGALAGGAVGAADFFESLGVQVVPRDAWWRCLQAIRGADLVISGGGSLLQDETSARSLAFYAGHLLAARLLRRRRMVYAQGVGPLHLPSSRFLVRLALRGSTITVRDEESARLLEACGVAPGSIEVTADPVFGWEKAYPRAHRVAAASKGPAGFAIIWRSFLASDIGLRLLRPELEMWAKARGLKPIFFALQPGADVMELRQAGVPREDIVTNEEPHRWAEALSRCRLALSVRYHGILFSALAGVPALGVAYDPKVAALCRQLGLPEPVPVDGLDGAGLLARLDELEANADAWRAGLRPRLAHLAERALYTAQLAVEVAKAAGVAKGAAKPAKAPAEPPEPAPDSAEPALDPAEPVPDSAEPALDPDEVALEPERVRARGSAPSAAPEAAPGETAPQEMARREAGSREAALQEAAFREAGLQEAALQEAALQEAPPRGPAASGRGAGAEAAATADVPTAADVPRASRAPALPDVATTPVAQTTGQAASVPSPRRMAAPEPAVPEPAPAPEQLPATARRARVAAGRADVLGVGFDIISREEAVERILQWTQGGAKSPVPVGGEDPARTGRGRLVVTANPELVMRAQRDEALANVLSGAALVVADGVGIVWAARRLGSPLPGRIPGIELAEEVMAKGAASGLRVYLCGSRPGVAPRAAVRLRRRFPGLEIVGAAHGYFDETEEGELLERIAASGAQLLLAGLGAPRQELWLHQNLPRLGVPVAMGVGGALDVWAGRVKRAPRLMRMLGIEWLWRLISQPRRAGRMLALPRFAWRVWRYRP